MLVFVISLAMLVTLLLAALVVAYVAYPHQGKDIPRAGWLSDAMTRAVDRWGVPTEPGRRQESEEQLHVSRGGIHRSSKR